MSDKSPIEKLQLTNLADYHCHCDYSSDAVGTIDDYCRAALEKGLVEICFTTHYDSNPNNQGTLEFIRVRGEQLPVKPDNLAPYVEDVLKAGQTFYDYGLLVKLGLEFGWYPGCEEAATRLKERFGFEHFLCGIHELDDICFCCQHTFEECFGRYSAEEVVDRYAEQVIAAANSSVFDCIAHLDYLRKYGDRFYGTELADLFRDRAAPAIFEALRNSETTLEINTSGMRRGNNNYYPSLGIINAARRAGVDVRYLGSDVHAPEQVGFDFDMVAPLASMTTVNCGE